MTVSQAAPSEPPMVTARKIANAVRATPASGVRSGMSSASNVIGRCISPNPRWPRRLPALACAASLKRSMSPRRLPVPSPGGGLSRAASHRLPSRTMRAMTRPAANNPTWAPSRVQKTPSKPTLAYHRASVHRSRPKLNRMMIATTMAIPTPEADAPAGPAVVTPVVGAARRSATRRPLIRLARRPGLDRCAPARARGRGRRRRRRSSSSPPSSRPPSFRGSGGVSPRACASRRRSSSMKSSNMSRIVGGV